METNLIETLTTLLVCSQQYMKDQKVLFIIAALLYLILSSHLVPLNYLHQSSANRYCNYECLFMHTFQDECSFVSLRDVVRTMIVFEYFYTKMIHFEEAAMEARKDDQSQVHCYYYIGACVHALWMLCHQFTGRDPFIGGWGFIAIAFE